MWLWFRTTDDYKRISTFAFNVFGLPFYIALGICFCLTVWIQHYDRWGQYDVALSKIDEAIEHTPTVIDLYFAKVSSAS